MGNFTINDMLAMQQALQEKYKGKWEAIGPERKERFRGAHVIS